MNTLPRPRIYKDQAEQMREYRKRRRATLDAARELVAKVEENKRDPGYPLSEALEEMTPEQRAALVRLLPQQKTVTELKGKAA
jgi:hypothetical protein